MALGRLEEARAWLEGLEPLPPEGAALMSRISAGLKVEARRQREAQRGNEGMGWAALRCRRGGGAAERHRWPSLVGTRNMCASPYEGEYLRQNITFYLAGP